MPFIAILIILLATLENMWPLLAGYLNTPPGAVFLGTVHHPADYFYYLSQFAQGAYRTVTTVDLFTTEQIAPTFVGWSNVLTGKLFWLLGLSPLIAYHTSVLLFTVLLLIAAYNLAFSVLRSTFSASIALYLFALFHAFPILRDGKPSYGDFFNNFAVPRVRFGGVPHQLLLTSASMILIYFIIQWIQHKQTTRRTLVGLGLSSLVLASLQPVLWTVIITALVLTLTLDLFTKHLQAMRGNKIFADRFPSSKIKRALNAENRHEDMAIDSPASSGARKFLLPRIGLLLITLSGSGIPPILYLRTLFTSPPFLQLRIWESAQQTTFTAAHFLSATGPIFLVAFISLPFYLSRPSFSKLLSFFFVLVSLSLFLSPLPVALGLSHVRFMSTLTILFLSTIAADGLYKIGLFFETGNRDSHEAKGILSKTTARLPWFMTLALICKRALSEVWEGLYGIPRRSRTGFRKDVPGLRAVPWLSVLILIILSLYLLPNHVKTLRLVSAFEPANAYHYLSEKDVALLRDAGALSTPNDTFLIIWPYNELFPALTGRRTYHGHPLLTIDVVEKSDQADAFFRGAWNQDQMQDFVSKSGINYVITYAWQSQFIAPAGFTKVIGSDTLVVYRVHK